MTKHKHKFFPTEDFDNGARYEMGDNPPYSICVNIDFEYGIKRKWVCECGKTKWVKEK